MNTINLNKNYSLGSKIFTFLIIIFPIINQYYSPIPGILFGELALIILLPFLIGNIYKKNLEINSYWIFVIYSIISSLIVILFIPIISGQDVFIRIIRETFYFIVIFIFARYCFNLTLGIKIYKIFVVLICIYIFLQYVFYYYKGIILPWFIKNIKIAESMSNEEYYQHFIYYFKAIMYRPSSIFLEPSWFSVYVLPCLALQLFSSDGIKKSNYILSALISIAVVICTSGIGLFFISLIWLLWLFKGLKTTGSKKIFLYSVFIGALIIAFILLYSYVETFKMTVGRYSTLNLSGGESSANERILKGFEVFNNFDPSFKLFGIGSGSFNSFALNKHLITIYDGNNIREYMNSISYILVSGGLIGLGLFILAMFSLFKNSNLISKILIMLIIGLFFTESFYNSPSWVLMMVFILAYKMNSYQNNEMKPINLKGLDFKYDYWHGNFKL